MRSPTRKRFISGFTLFLALAWSSCGDDPPEPCEHRGTVRCGASGRHIEYCDGQGNLHWRPEGCPGDAPLCAPDTRGVPHCVSDSLGACDATSFAGQCVDDHTVEHCDGHVRRTRCAEAERCVRLPGDRIVASATGSFACVPTEDPYRPPALVTLIRGGVRLGADPAPQVPFQVTHGVVLHLDEGASAVVLVKSRASRLDGPAEVDVYELQPEGGVPNTEAAAIIARLSATPPTRAAADEPLIRPAPSGDGVIRWMLGEGVPGAAASLGEIAWRCAEPPCTETVELSEGTQVLFRSQGDGSVRYDGPPLAIDHHYTLRVGEHRYPLETEPPIRLDTLMGSMSAWNLEEQMSVLAAVHYWGGSRAAALQALRRAREGDYQRFPEIDALRAAYGDTSR